MPASEFEGRDWPGWTVPEIVDVEGVPTAYRRGGQGETLVYLHGGGGTRAWTHMHEHLAQHFDVIAPEHPGYGDTPRGAHQDSWADYVLHYDAFLRELGLGDVHLVGTSLGGWLAANLAVYYPTRFKSLTLVTPIGVRDPEDPFLDLFRLAPEEEADRMFNGRADRYAGEFEQEGEVDDAVHAFNENTTSALLMWNPRYERKFDIRLARVRIPTLIIGAEDDRLAGNGTAPRYASLLPNSELVLIPGPGGEPSSHGLPMEQPAEVASEIVKHVTQGG